MIDSYIEDRDDVFPINNLVRCGQSGYRLGFAHMTLEDFDQARPSHLQRTKQGRFMPRVPAKK